MKLVVRQPMGSSSLEAEGQYFVILSSIDLGSRMKVGKVTLLKSAPGRSWEMMWDKTVGEVSLKPLTW